MVAAALAGLAAALLVRASPPVSRERRPGRLRAGAVIPLTAVAASWLLLDGLRIVLALILVAAGTGVLRILARGRAARAADRRAVAVLEACEAMSADLAAGQSPVAVLERAAREWDFLEPAASAARLDAEVPATLRRLSTQPGGAELRGVAAAWQVAHHSGSSLAETLRRTADAIRERRRTSRLVATELAAAHATARMMCLLPLVVLALGSGLGVHPWAFLAGTPAGLACLGAGVLLGLAGMAWIQHIADAVLR